MSIHMILSLLNTVGFLAAGGAIVLIAYTFYLAVHAPPKLLKEQIIKLTPIRPEDLPPMKRIVEVTVPENVEAELQHFFAEDRLLPDWNRSETGGASA